MEFRVYGPFELPRQKSGLVAADAASRRTFWAVIEDASPGLTQACGCYVFAIKAARGIKPWYVGKSEKQPFRKECLTPHKINHYNDGTVPRRGRPLLYLIAQVAPSGRFRKPTSTKRPAIAALALTKNSELLNVSGTRMHRELVVHGVLNSPSRGTGVAGKELRKILGAK